MMSCVRGATAITALALVVGALGGCTSSGKPTSSANPEPEMPVINASQAVDEYTQRQSAWTLPEGVVWLEGLGPTRDENGKVLEDQPVAVGGAADMADIYWLCAWRWAYLTALDNGETARADAAMTMLFSFKKSPLWRLAEGEITKASLGDPSELRLYYEHQCGHLVFAE